MKGVMEEAIFTLLYIVLSIAIISLTVTITTYIETRVKEALQRGIHISTLYFIREMPNFSLTTLYLPEISSFNYTLPLSQANFNSSSYYLINGRRYLVEKADNEIVIYMVEKH